MVTSLTLGSKRAHLFWIAIFWSQGIILKRDQNKQYIKYVLSIYLLGGGGGGGGQCPKRPRFLGPFLDFLYV